MSSIKIISSILVIYISSVRCSVAPAVALSQPAYTYARVAPPSTIPFAASVSTFTRGLNVYAAPYAAGVAPLPYYTRSILPSAPVYHGAYAPSFVPAAHPALGPVPVAGVPFPPSFRVAPNLIPQGVQVPSYSSYPGTLGVPVAAPGVAVPSSLLPAPFGVDGRSGYAVSPTVPVAHTLG